MSTFSIRFWFVLFAVLLAVGFSFNRAIAQDDGEKKVEAKEGDAKEGETDGEEAEPKDPLAVPEGDAEELLEFIREMNMRRPKGESRKELIANYRKIQRAIVGAADRLLAASLKDEESGLQYAAVGVQMKVRSLRLLQQLGDETAAKDLKDFVAGLTKDERPEISAIGEELALQIKFEFPLGADEDTVRGIADEMKKEFGKGEVKPQQAGMIAQVLQRVERSGYVEMAADLNVYFAERFAKSDNERVAGLAARLEGTARRLNLPGNPIEVAGTCMDGSELDWDSYRGKVVLVDYWATWCGPCIQELPNVLANYESYHDRGFDVVGICIDENREAVEKFLEDKELPWKTIFSDDPDATGWEHPMAVKYGVGGIPTVILVDKKGKVVSLNARGKQLSRLLEELIGPLEDDDDGKDDEGKSDSDDGESDEKQPG